MDTVIKTVQIKMNAKLNSVNGFISFKFDGWKTIISLTIKSYLGKIMSIKILNIILAFYNGYYASK